MNKCKKCTSLSYIIYKRGKVKKMPVIKFTGILTLSTKLYYTNNVIKSLTNKQINKKRKNERP